MRSISRKNRAFTLVEILIVVVILGILAAIVVPQFASAADEARGSNIASQLSTLQNNIELFRAREGDYPDFSGNGWGDMLGDFDGDGTLDAGATQYIKAAPSNPAWPTAASNTSVTEAATTGSATFAWVWDETAGVEQIFASYYDEDGDPAAVTTTATD